VFLLLEKFSTTVKPMEKLRSHLVLYSNIHVLVVVLRKIDKIIFNQDDGPHREYTALVLDVLKAANVTATFFLTGINGFEYNETRYRATVKRMFEEVRNQLRLLQ